MLGYPEHGRLIRFAAVFGAVKTLLLGKLHCSFIE